MARDPSQPSSRGRKPFEMSEEVDRGLTTLLDSTDVSFDKIAEAVEQAGGPRKLWLRRRFEQITGTKCFGFLRLRNDRARAEDLRRRQLGAQELARSQLRSGHAPINRSQSSITPARADSVQSRRASIFDSQVYATTPRTVRDVHSQTYGAIRPPSMGQSSAATTLIKRAISNDEDDSSRTDYVSRKRRARALSLTEITYQLEKLTGETGLYEYIRRGSTKSHISPLVRSFRWSRGSKTSGRSSVLGSRIYDMNSENGNERMFYVPDPDYETFYYRPDQELLDPVGPTETTAVAALIHAKAGSLSDDEAHARVLKLLPEDPSARGSWITAADDNGVTAMHLAVAYGFPRICAMLMREGANVRAKTSRGSSICRFAKPAQHLAEDTSGFHRILHCRVWVCSGRAPPSPSDADAQNSPELRGGDRSSRSARFRTNDRESTLYTVNETQTGETVNSSPELYRTSTASYGTGSGLTPIVTSFGLEAGNINSISWYRPSLSNDSPVSADCLRDHGPVTALLTPDSTVASAHPASFRTSYAGPSSDLSPHPLSTQEDAGTALSTDITTNLALPTTHTASVVSTFANTSQPITPWSISSSPDLSRSQRGSLQFQPRVAPGVSVPEFDQFNTFGGLNLLANTNFATTSYPRTYDNEPRYVATTASQMPHPLHWTTANNNRPSRPTSRPGPLFDGLDGFIDLRSDQQQTLSYQGETAGRPLRVHYPTPPGESVLQSQPEPAYTWTDWNVSNATALALAEQYSFNAPPPMWYGGDPDDSSNNHHYLFNNGQPQNFQQQD